MRSLGLFPLLLVALALLLLTAEGQDKMPTDEQGLFQYAQRHMNRRDWRQADRAFRLLLEKFPESKLVEQVFLQMGHLHVHYSRQPAKGREWLGKIKAESTYYWQARHAIAQSWAQERNTAEAIREYKFILKNAPEARDRTRAAHAILRAQNKYFHLYVNQSFTEGEVARVQFSTRNIRSVDATLYRIPFEELIERLDPKQPSLPLAARGVPREKWKKIKSWTQTIPGNWSNYRNTKVEMPADRRGFYVVEAHHEDVTMTVSFPVNRYGLIAKSAAGKSLVFAQNRVTGAPVQGMRLRIVRPDGTTEFVTGADGLVETDKIPSGGFAVGVFDDDYCFVNVATHGWQGKESRYYITTDRPIYRPNQTVQFKIVHRTEEGASLEIQKDLRVQVRILDSKGNEVHKGDYAVNEFGTLSGRFVLGDEPALGVYRILVEPLVASAPIYDWRGRFGQFRVDEYRKPEFKVGVEFDKPYYVQGGKLHATIRADYYFGSPVPEAAVSYRVMRRSYWHRVPYRCAWYSWYIEEDYGWRRHHGDTVLQGSGKTDKQGRLELEVPLARWEYDAEYTVVAQVTDLSRRQVDGSGTVRANRAEFSLTVETDRYLYKPGDKLVARVTALRPDGTPVKDRKIRVTALRRWWRNKQWGEEEKVRAEGRTNEKGVAEVPLQVALSGSYYIRASAADDQGNETWTKRWVWVASPDWDGGLFNWQGADIVADKPMYRRGEVATFLVSSQVKDLHVLVSFESTRIHRQMVVKLNGHTATVSVKLDDATMAPNFFATVTALYGSKIYQRQRSVAVDPGDRFLTVDIQPSREKYKPRDPAKIDIVTRDHQGNPVSAEVSLAIVDESIFALQKPYAMDIRRFFVRKRWNRVTTMTSLQYWQSGEGGAEEESMEVMDAVRSPAAPRAQGKMGRAMEPGLAADAEDAGAYAETEVRSKFADTMLWNPTVTTDEQGRATVRLDEIADNLTTWRISAQAISREGLMGQSKRTILVRKDVIVRLHTPRFYTQGDKAVVSAVVHNYLDTEKEIKVVLEAEGLEVGGAVEQLVTVEAEGEKRIDWPATVAAPGRATITVSALTDEESDAMELVVPLLPHGSVAWTSSTHLVEGALDVSVNIPDDTIAEATELLVVVSPTHAATVLDALDWLADYPYGCVEQTMSRFLPSAITAQVLRKLNLRKPGLEEELPAMINQGLQRLYNFQQPDGGWGWWRHDGSNPYTTAYVVYGLAMAQEADVAVAPRVLQRGVQRLRQLLSKAEGREERVYMLYALSAAGQKVPSVRNALADDLRNLAPVYKAMLASVLKRDGEPREAARVLKALEGDAISSGATVHFKGLETYRWTGHNVETTALALKAFLEVDPQNALVPKIVAWLAMNREGNRWVSTRQTAMVVYAMADYLARSGDLDPDLTLTLSVNGRRILHQRVTKENWREFDGTVEVDRELLETGENRIQLLGEGRGTPVCSVFLKRFRKAETFEASRGGLRVERSYALVKTYGGKRLKVPLDDGAQVKSGDEIEVTLKVSADRGYDYLILEDPMPAGFEAVRDEARYYGRWNWWYSHKEFRDEKVAIAITHLPEGERAVTYTMRAETPGQFRVLPALVWNMYRAEEGGNSAGRSIRVVD